jgi:hypothetical protein
MTPSAIVSPAALPVETPDLDRLLSAIAQVETGSNPSAIGKHQERSAYQLTEAAWKETTDLPWAMALNPPVAAAVARARLVSIRNGLLQEHLQPSVYNMALAWNGGRSRVILQRWEPPKVIAYAIRVENAYYGR